MVLGKQGEAVLFFVAEKKWPSEQTHRVAGLLLQGDLYCKATHEKKEKSQIFRSYMSFIPFDLKLTSFPHIP